ncbi:MAG: transposase [Chloroflexi bacterium]|nr:transposase [Chloroflexota bacterium]NOG64100.1 transposase [Chloroflexota bacterium]
MGEKIQQFYQKSRGTYGSRRIWADLREMGKGKYHKILSSNTLYFVLICVAGRILLVKQYQAAIPVQGGWWTTYLIVSVRLKGHSLPKIM